MKSKLYEYSLVFLILAIATSLFGQRKKRKAGQEIYISGGIFWNFDGVYSYVGPSILNVGYYRYYGDKIMGVDIEGLHFESRNRTEIITEYRADVSGYYLYKLKEVNGFQLFAGSFISLGYDHNNLSPETSLSIPTTNNAIVLGLGGKAILRARINNKVTFISQIKLGVADMEYIFRNTRNPILTRRQQKTRHFHFDLIRRQTYFLIGLSYKI